MRSFLYAVMITSLFIAVVCSILITFSGIFGLGAFAVGFPLLGTALVGLIPKMLPVLAISAIIFLATLAARAVLLKRKRRPF